MAFKGFNSILFDFDTVVDMKLSLLNWFKNKHKGNIEFFSKDFINLPLEDHKFKRIHGIRDILVSAVNQEVSDEDVDVVYKMCDNVLTSAWRDFEKELLENAILTDVYHLIRGYNAAGEGTIKAVVRCDTNAQSNFIHKFISKDIMTIVQDRSDVDMGKYGRLVTGYYANAYKYKLMEPKSILVANYRENFARNDITLLNPELVINLGDINDIAVISVYREEEIKSEG